MIVMMDKPNSWEMNKELKSEPNGSKRVHLKVTAGEGGAGDRANEIETDHES